MSWNKVKFRVDNSPMDSHTLAIRTCKGLEVFGSGLDD